MLDAPAEVAHRRGMPGEAAVRPQRHLRCLVLQAPHSDAPHTIAGGEPARVRRDTRRFDHLAAVQPRHEERRGGQGAD